MPRQVVVTRSSVVPRSPQVVWDRVTSPEGIDAEMRPLLSMRMPREMAGRRIEDLPLDEPLGRAWLLLLGVLPVEYDDFSLMAVDPPRSFHEDSRLLSARRWQHRRELEPVTGGTRVTDTLTVDPRALVPGLLVRAVVGALFAHRHLRLARWARTSLS